VRNLGRGRAFFGFESLHTRSKAYRESPAGRLEARRLRRDELVCEKRVRMSARIDKIVADDRRLVDDL
jgi:hypothetical protein